MKSIGECMAIGRNFKESLQKAIRSLEIGLKDLMQIQVTKRSKSSLLNLLCQNLPNKFLVISECIRKISQLRPL